ncbi:hypothetical protein GLYMA_03G031300v4 [Glycine max]|uniref:Cytochrome P450 n=1 Tax=Glycine max TaxID=3847 RepID=A0A0R0KE81_SOYBN|nr:hypothetical protein JHK85_006372 [Glycine max]KAG5070989.1 hypothetical protein JHK86_006200 [Glycine max]KAH1068439.1 hypothetical protein GYH30_006124 [Glycine max]KRH65374.1 hypothetical protein GLYMA_03G031300v4 [Glycine max]
MLLPLVLCLALPVLFMFFIQNLSTLIKKPPHPPGPKGLPIIGNLHQLDNSILCLQLWQLSKKYDPLFSLQLGLRPAIVISSPKLAKRSSKTMTLSFVDDLNYLPNRNCPIMAQILYFPLTMSIGEKSEKFMLSISLAPSVSVSTFSSIRNFEVKQMLKK